MVAYSLGWMKITNKFHPKYAAFFKPPYTTFGYISQFTAECLTGRLDVSFNHIAGCPLSFRKCAIPFEQCQLSLSVVKDLIHVWQQDRYECVTSFG
jgi:hypothetical protein